MAAQHSPWWWPSPDSGVDREGFARDQFDKRTPPEWQRYRALNWAKPETRRRWVAGFHPGPHRGPFVAPAGQRWADWTDEVAHTTTLARLRHETRSNARNFHRPGWYAPPGGDFVEYLQFVRDSKLRAQTWVVPFTPVSPCGGCGRWMRTEALRSSFLNSPLSLLGSRRSPTLAWVRRVAETPSCARCRSKLSDLQVAVQRLQTIVSARQEISREMKRTTAP